MSLFKCNQSQLACIQLVTDCISTGTRNPPFNTLNRFSLAEAVNTFVAPHGEDPGQGYDQLQAEHLQLRQSALQKARAFDREHRPDTSLEELV